MEPRADRHDFPHDAFISYSRRDIDFARVLEKTLEAYSPPKDLGLPQRRLDVFRDEGDITGVDYGKAIERHLTNSRKLLVVCSPQARASTYVDDENRRFARLRGADHIIPILLSGIPNNEAKSSLEQDMAFPAALCEVMSMPLASSYRDFKYGRDKVNKGIFDDSWFTILANLYDVSRSEIEQREKKRQARNRRIRNAVIAGVGTALSLLTAWALLERDVAINRANHVLARQLATKSSSIQLQQSWDSLVLSALLVIESVNYAPTAEGLGTLRNRVSLLPGPPESVGGGIDEAWAVDATGKVVVVKEQERIVLKALPHGEEVGALADETCGAICTDIKAIAVSEAGHHLVIAGAKHAELFRLEGQSYLPTAIKCTALVQDPYDDIQGIALSPDARVLGVVLGWGKEWRTKFVGINFAGGKCEPLALDVGQITEPSSVAFGADGRSIAVSGAEFTLTRRGFVGLWELPDLAQGAEPQSEHLSNATKVLGEEYVERIAVGQIPIGDDRTTQRLAAQFGDNITVWEVIGDKLEEVARIPGGEQTLLGFLGGGSAPLTFNAQTKQILAWPLRGPATWEAFRESDSKIVFGSQNNSLLTATWRALEDANRGDIDSVPSISTWPASGSPPLDSQWSRETWNLTDISLGVDVSSSDAFALSPDGQFVLVALENNMRSIVNIQAKKPIATFSLPKVGSTTGLSPEARVIGYVDTSDRGDAVILVDPSGRKNPRTKVFSEKIGALAFSGDGQHIVVAVGGDSNIITTIIRLQLDGLTETARFDVDKPIATVGMNSDGTLIAVAGRSTVRVWQVPLPSVLGFFTHAAVPTLNYEVHTAVDLDIESVALSRDGTDLATASTAITPAGDHITVLQVWRFARDTLAREACRRIGRDLTWPEWATYLPGEPYKPTCTRLR